MPSANHARSRLATPAISASVSSNNSRSGSGPSKNRDGAPPAFLDPILIHDLADQQAIRCAADPRDDQRNCAAMNFSTLNIFSRR
jgi:hypothetical protein